MKHTRFLYYAEQFPGTFLKVAILKNPRTTPEYEYLRHPNKSHVDVLSGITIKMTHQIVKYPPKDHQKISN